MNGNLTVVVCQTTTPQRAKVTLRQLTINFCAVAVGSYFGILKLNLLTCRRYTDALCENFVRRQDPMFWRWIENVCTKARTLREDLCLPFRIIQRGMLLGKINISGQVARDRLNTGGQVSLRFGGLSGTFCPRDIVRRGTDKIVGVAPQVINREVQQRVRQTCLASGAGDFVKVKCTIIRITCGRLLSGNIVCQHSQHLRQ